MSTLARLEDEWHDEVPVARVEGEVDASNVKEISSQGDKIQGAFKNKVKYPPTGDKSKDRSRSRQAGSSHACASLSDAPS